MNGRSIVAVGVTGLLLVLSGGVAQGQEPMTPKLEDGDIVWTFADEEPFFDARVAGALGALMASRIEAETPEGTRIVRVEANGPDYIGGTIYAASEVEPLLAAAGFDPAAPFELIGACRYWTPDAADSDVPWNTPASPAGVVVAAFNAALRELGVQPTACETVSDPNQAHLIFWQWGEEVPTLSRHPAATLLTGSGSLPPLSPGLGGGVPGGVVPATTGNAGLPERSTTVALVVGAMAVTILFVLAARRRTA